MGILSSSQKMAKECLNYFLYNIRQESSTAHKFQISIVYTQLEVGLFDQFFSISFGLYSHLVTHSYCVKIWGELELQGITLRPSFQSTWTPDPLSNSDIALMEIVVKTYSKKGSSIINRCRMFLQVISIDDLLIPNTGHIHPAYILGTLPLGHTSKITWPSFPKPPKSYWNL